MLVFLALGDAKVLSFALGDAKVPDTRYFAFWWNIGFKDCEMTSHLHFMNMSRITISYVSIYFYASLVNN